MNRRRQKRPCPLCRQEPAPCNWPAQHNKTPWCIFFAPWCAVCKVSMPSLNLLSGDDLRVVVVALDWQNPGRSGSVRQQWFSGGSVTWAQPARCKRWQIDAFPSYYVVSAGCDGGILHPRPQRFTLRQGLLLRIPSNPPYSCPGWPRQKPHCCPSNCRYTRRSKGLSPGFQAAPQGSCCAQGRILNPGLQIHRRPLNKASA